MKQYVKLFTVLILNLLILIFSIKVHYMTYFGIKFCYIIIIVSTVVLIKMTKRKLLRVFLLTIMIIYSVLLFVFIFKEKAEKYDTMVSQSINFFLTLPKQNITAINIVANPLNIKQNYKFVIKNNDIITEFLSSLKTCKQMYNPEIHMWDFYAITFINDQNIEYSIVLKKNCHIPDNKRSELCNAVFIKLEPNFNVFTKHGEYEGVVFYSCDDLVPLLNKYIETRIKQNPKGLYQEIN